MYYDQDDQVGSSMGIYGQATIDDALREAYASFHTFPADRVWEAPHITYLALYQDNITEVVRNFFLNNKPKKGFVVWYQVIATGSIYATLTEVPSFAEAHLHAHYPEVLPGEVLVDYIEILGIAQSNIEAEKNV